jgi:calcineurin-like phosphoesterase family protein
MNFFTSDTHFGHRNVIKYDNRPFVSVEEHDNTIIDNWNRVVGKKDEVYHLGDFTMGGKAKALYYLGRLNGKIHLIRGNHDDSGAWKIRNMFVTAREAAYIRIDKVKIYIHHYACRVWRDSHHGSWHLFGHSHDYLPMWGKSMDVGLASAARILGGGKENYRPLSFDEVRVVLEKGDPNVEGSAWSTGGRSEGEGVDGRYG